MDVAVIIPLFNGARWIGETLACVAAQTRRPTEVVVVDDGSADGSREIAAKYPGVRVLRNPSRGSNAARNFGLANTTAELVAFLDHDDLWHPTHLATLVDVLQTHPDCPAAYATVDTFPDGQKCGFRPAGRAIRPLDPWASYPQQAAVGPPSALLVRRSVLDRVGGWSVEFTGISDYHLWLVVTAHTPLRKCAAQTTGYRLHRNSMSFQKRAGRAVDYLQTRRKAAADALRYRLEAHPEQEAILTRRLQLAADAIRLGQAYRESDAAAFRDAARGLESSVSGEPPATIRRFFIDLLWYFAPAVGFAEKSKLARAALAEWSRWWPDDARRTRRVLRQLLWLSSLARAIAPWWEMVSPAWIDRVSGVLLRRIQ